ncbi:AfsR/SARP family transcriptional regulator [Streptosporangium sp. OZ121]|uniref:AfsR/SARP family transcriptional regulator n=1 Tax=Streptosporangium sp. OZ121 TaxID=3444183 RepID=UPI003F7AAEDA
MVIDRSLGVQSRAVVTTVFTARNDEESFVPTGTKTNGERPNSFREWQEMQFRILGPVEICDDKRHRRFVPPGRKQRALLATLVIRAGHVLPVDRLINELWGANPPATAVNSLQATIARLRRLMDVPKTGDGTDWVILTQDSGYVMRPGRQATDVDRFTELADEGRAIVAMNPGRAVALLRQSLALWRGPALEDAICGDICATFAIQLEEKRLAVLEALYDAGLRTARHAEIIGELEALVGEHPFRERFHDLLMVALYRSGRQPEALAVYERLRARLSRELGLEPSPALQQRVQEVLNRTAELDGAARPGRRTTPAGTPETDLIVSGLFREVGHLRHRLELLTREYNALHDRFDALVAPLARPKAVGE